MSPKHLEIIASATVGQILRRLPESLREPATKCLVEFHWQVEPALLEPGLFDDLLGLFEGYPHGMEDLVSTPADLPRIHLFLSNMWTQSGCNRVRFREEVRITFLHELGHFFGLNEQQVEELGLA